MLKLHFIIDPLCGWTYAANNLFIATQQITESKIQLHCGGMLAFERKRKITPQWRDFAQSNDSVINQVSGMAFGTAYQTLLSDLSYELDSTPASKVILAMQQMQCDVVAVLSALQRAYYRDGAKLSEPDVVKSIALKQGLNQAEFEHVLQGLTDDVMQLHYQQTQALLTSVAGKGFPSCVLETSEGFELIALEPYYGDTPAWLELLESRLSADQDGGQMLSKREKRNIEIIKSTYEGGSSAENALNLRRHLSPEVSWREAQGFPYAGTYQGVEQIMAQVFEPLQNDWDEYRCLIDDYIAKDNMVLAYGTYQGIFKASKKHFSARVVHIWQLQQEKVIDFEQIVDSQQVCAAMIVD